EISVNDVAAAGADLLRDDTPDEVHARSRKGYEQAHFRRLGDPRHPASTLARHSVNSSSGSGPASTSLASVVSVSGSAIASTAESISDLNVSNASFSFGGSTCTPSSFIDIGSMNISPRLTAK